MKLPKTFQKILLYTGIFSALTLGCGGSGGGSKSAGIPYIPTTPVTPITNKAPVISVANPLSGSSYLRGSSFNLDATASDPDGDSIASNGWDLGGLVANLSNLTGTVNIPLNSSLGNYVLTAYAVDGRNARGETDVNIYVLNNPPVADLSKIVNTNVTCDNTNIYDFTSTDVDGTIKTYTIDWDGDAPSNIPPVDIIGGSTTAYAYDCAIFTGLDTQVLLKLTVTDNDDSTDTDTKIITIHNPN